jgi:hypothetical protein
LTARRRSGLRHWRATWIKSNRDRPAKHLELSLMLRRKLLLNLGPVVVLLLLTAVIAIWLLQGVLRDMDHINTQAWRLVEDVNELSISVNAIEVDL